MYFLAQYNREVVGLELLISFERLEHTLLPRNGDTVDDIVAGPGRQHSPAARIKLRMATHAVSPAIAANVRRALRQGGRNLAMIFPWSL